MAVFSPCILLFWYCEEADRIFHGLRGCDEGSTEGETGNKLLMWVSNLVLKKYRPRK
jgi:hypothetical protein